MCDRIRLLTRSGQWDDPCLGARYQPGTTGEGQKNAGRGAETGGAARRTLGTGGAPSKFARSAGMRCVEQAWPADEPLLDLDHAPLAVTRGAAFGLRPEDRQIHEASFLIQILSREVPRCRSCSGSQW